MDLLKQLAVDTVVSKIQSGEWTVDQIAETDESISIRVMTGSKQEAIKAVEKPKPAASTTPKKHILHRSPEAREQLRTKIYDVLSFDKPLQCKEIASHPSITVGPSAVLKALREMPGAVSEVSGNKTKNFKFIRKPIAGDVIAS